MLDYQAYENDFKQIGITDETEMKAVLDYFYALAAIGAEFRPNEELKNEW